MAETLIKIPLAASVAHQVSTVTLDGRRFELRIDWIQRVRRWSLSIATESGVSLLRCKFLALRSDLLRQIRAVPEAPQGVLTLLDLENQDGEAEFGTLGKRHALVYYSTGAAPPVARTAPISSGAE